MHFICILFSGLLTIVHKFINTENGMSCGTNLIALIQGFMKQVKDGKYGSQACERFVKCVGCCAVVCIINLFNRQFKKKHFYVL